MHHLPLFATLCFLALPSCATLESKPPHRSDQAASPALDQAQREQLLGAVKGLAGRWNDATNGETVFEVTSGGSAIRETMFPGQPHEMTNMYTLDGNDLCMTHYCGAGNQPHMRARRMADSALAFEPDGVSDLKSPGELHMGQMTLIFVDTNHIEQHWQAFADGKPDHAMVFHFERQ